MATMKEPTKKELRKAAADRILGGRFYYLYDNKGRPRVAIYLAYGYDVEVTRLILVRGVAICSDSEPSVNKKRGRTMAKGRAIAALGEGQSGRPIKRNEAKLMLGLCSLRLPKGKRERLQYGTFSMKSYFNTKRFPWEKGMLLKPKKEK